MNTAAINQNNSSDRCDRCSADTGSETYGFETITPEYARELLTLNTRNRRSKPPRIAMYARDMKEGRWKRNFETISISSDGILLDGQNRLYACIEADTPFDAFVVWGLDEGAQETIDIGQTRTTSDILTLRGEANSGALGTALRGVRIWEDGAYQTGIGVSTLRYSNPEILETLERHPDIRNSLHEIRVLRERLGIPGPVGAALTYGLRLIHEDDANDFFDRLISGVGLNYGEPIYALREVLMKSASFANKRPIERSTITAAIMCKGWNKYRDGDDCTNLRFRAGGSSPEAWPTPR